MVNFPSLLLSISLHSLVFLILSMSVQFKTNTNSLDGYVINFQLTEYNHIEKKTKKNTNEKLFNSKKFYEQKVTDNKNMNSKISNVIDSAQINNKKTYTQTKVMPKEKKILKTKVMPKEKKIFKFEDKKITVKTSETKTLFQSNFSEQRMSKFSLNIEKNNYNLQPNKKSQYNTARSCRYTKRDKSTNILKNPKMKIIDNNEITISELLGNNYYNPKLVNINHLLKMPQIQLEHRVNITNLLVRNNKKIINCN